MLDIIIRDAVVLTMAGSGIGMIPQGAVGIKGNHIVCVDDSDFIVKNYKAEEVIDAKGKILLPGFINVHCHSYYGMMCRGILTDLEFFLEQGLAGYLDTLDIEKEIISCKAHLLEGVRHGTTTFGDMVTDCNVLSKVHEEFGVRARLSEMIRELPWDIADNLDGNYTFDRSYAQNGINATLKLLDQYGTDPNERISGMVGFQALDYVSQELVIELRETAKKYNAMIHTHLAQSPFEIRQIEKRFGVRPVEAFDKLGLLNGNTIAAHLVYNTKDENKKAAGSGLKMAYCPCSWGEVGVSPPSAQYLYHGGIVGIGSDEAAYTGVNPIADMKVGYINTNIDAYNNKVPNVPMSSILRMHTIEAAKVLGMEDITGSLEPGKRADIIIINPDTINMRPMLVNPLTNVPQNIVSTATGNEIETVIIDGQIIMENYQFKNIDEAAIIEETQKMGQEAAVAAAEYYGKLERSEVLERQEWLEKF